MAGKYVWEKRLARITGLTDWRWGTPDATAPHLTVTWNQLAARLVFGKERLQVFMIKLSSIKSTMKLTFSLEISENLNVFEYVKKNRRLLHRWGMCYPINTFATCNRWEFETKAGLTTKMAIVISVRLADSVGFEIESVLNAKICSEFQV